MEDAKVENSRYNVIPVTDYDPFEVCRILLRKPCQILEVQIP